MVKRNLHAASVDSFGDEWARFDQRALGDSEARKIFDEYFDVFPWELVGERSVGFDMGCGTGRWARFVAPKVGHLHCIDPSKALDVAMAALSSHDNVSFHRCSVDEGALPQGSQDFGYSLGVLHHLPDTFGGLRSCVELLKPGAPFLLYLYYAFDNRSLAFRLVWRASDLLRRAISRMPPRARDVTTDIIAVMVYYPVARLCRWAEKRGLNVANVPLSYYRDHSLYTMRTDSRDRFGTPLEKRFTRREVQRMMEDAGLVDIRFSEHPPYWCAVGFRK
ncbi:MAG: class I SAM-dependent methyltransferase [Burkholderiales bacterium]